MVGPISIFPWILLREKWLEKLRMSCKFCLESPVAISSRIPWWPTYRHTKSQRSPASQISQLVHVKISTICGNQFSAPQTPNLPRQTSPNCSWWLWPWKIFKIWQFGSSQILRVELTHETTHQRESSPNCLRLWSSPRINNHYVYGNQKKADTYFQDGKFMMFSHGFHHFQVSKRCRNVHALFRSTSGAMYSGVPHKV